MKSINNTDKAPVWERFKKLAHADDARAKGLTEFAMVPPHWVLETVPKLLGTRQFSCAIDPFAGLGILLTQMVETGCATSGIGHCMSEDERSFAVSLADTNNISWVVGDQCRDLSDSPKADLIISMPPWGTRHLFGSRLLSPEQILIDRWALLDEDAVGMAIVPPGFAFTKSKSSPVNALTELGLHCDALFELPRGTFSPTMQIGALIVIVRRGPIRPMFVAGLSGDMEQNERVVQNYHSRFIDKHNAAQGMLVLPEEYIGLQVHENVARLEKLGQRTGLPARCLGDLLVKINYAKADTSFEPEPNSVYLPLIGNSLATTSLSDIHIHHHKLAQLIVKSEVVDPSWLAGYFSSALGRIARESAQSGTALPRIAARDINRIQVYLPDLKVQISAVNAERGVRAIREELTALSLSVWTDPKSEKSLSRFLLKLDAAESFSMWVDRLPFPLASILWTYHAAGGDDKARYEHLLHFFEALAEFLALILLSACRSDEDLRSSTLVELHKALAAKNLGFERATFGTWKMTYSNLAKQLRQLQGPANRERITQILKTGQSDIWEMLLNKTLVSILDEVNGFRNSWTGHGGVVGPAEAKSRHSQLSEKLLKVRAAMGDVWMQYPLILPINSKFVEGMHRYTIQRVMGRSTPFEQITVDLSVPMADGQLHLLGTDSQEPLQLLPFVRVMQSPATASNACYFYNRRDPGSIRFVSYHFEQDADVSDTFPDVEAALQSLGSTGPPHETS